MKINHLLIYVLLFLVTSLGAIATVFTSEYFQISKVIASSATTLIFVLFSLPKKEQFTKFSMMFYVGSFIGMTSSTKLSEYYHFLVASFFAVIIFKLIENKFVGMGGKLGTIAFFSSLISWLIFGVIL